MNMKTIKVSEATDLALDWLVAKCEDYEIRPVMRGMKTGVRNYEHEPWWVFTPSTNWSQGGPIIERELIDIQAKYNSGSNIVPKGKWYWQASTVNEDDVAYWFDGPTLLIAAMRCYVASKLGDTVEVPEELV